MISSDVLAIVSVILSVSAVLLTFWQSIATRESNLGQQAQYFLSLRVFEKEVDLQKGVRAIRALGNFTDYDEYARQVPVEDQQAIRSGVRFLSFLWRSTEEGFIAENKTFNAYFVSIDAYVTKLAPWWLEGLRKTEPGAHSAFDRLCQRYRLLNRRTLNHYLRRNGLPIRKKR